MNNMPRMRFKQFNDSWSKNVIKDIFKYDRPDKYIVSNEQYILNGITPVLTANKAFILGYTDEKNTYNEESIIIDDFTLDSKYANFPYMVKSSAIKILTLKDNNNYNLHFLYYLLNSTQFELMGHARHYISYVQPKEIFVPTINEQLKIERLFSKFDELIELSDNKLNYLTELRKTLLEKLYIDDKSNKPELRFSNFKNEWHQIPLSVLSKKVLEKNILGEYSETFTNSAEFGIITQRDFFEHDITNNDNISNYYVVRENDFVYNPRISSFAPCGPINRNKLNRVGVMSPLYTVFRFNGVNNGYLEYYFKSNYWHKFMYFNGDTGARSDRFSIKDDIFFTMPIPLPEEKEQEEIYKLLNKIDIVINNQKNKLEKLNNIRNTLLEKMFV